MIGKGIKKWVILLNRINFLLLDCAVLSGEIPSEPMHTPAPSIKKTNFRWAIVAMLFFVTKVSTLGGMITALLIGCALNESGLGGYEIAFKVASCGYLLGIVIIHILVPRMKALTKI